MRKEKIKRRKLPKTRRSGKQVMKSGRQWKRSDETKRLRWFLIGIAVLLTILVAGAGYWVWSSLPDQFFAQYREQSSSVSELPPQEWDGKTLPVYSDSFNLVLVNATHELSADFTVNVIEIEGVAVEERIAKALRVLFADAELQGLRLKLVSGYVSKKEQEAQYQNKVQELMQQKGYSRIKAEDEALHFVGRGGYSEYQTGMAVNLSKDGLKSGEDFSKTEEYRWLLHNSITYGFIQRNPENKTSATGMPFEPGHFRYVGVDHAKAMRQLEMCLEEYTTYLYRQTHW